MKKDKNMFPIFVMVMAGFILSTIVSIWSLRSLARDNTKEINTLLTYRVYDTISSSLSIPITVSQAMCADSFLADALTTEDEKSEEQAIEEMSRYLNTLK